MAWLWGDTFDTYQEWWAKYENAAGPGGWVWIDVSYGRLPGNSALRTLNTYVHKSINPGPSHLGGRVCIVSMWVRVHNVSPETFLCAIREAPNHTHVSFTVEPSGAISAWAKYKGEQPEPMNFATGGVRLGRSAPGVIQTATWHLVEFQVLCETGGTLAVRVDKRIVLTMAEQPTANPDTRPGFHGVAFGSTGWADFDMLVICDGVGPTHNKMPGLTHSEATRVVAGSNGVSGPWLANVSGFGTLDMVDDAMNDHDNTVVFASANGDFELYTMAQPTTTKSGIQMVQVVSNAKVASTPRTLGHFLYADGDWTWRGKYFKVENRIPWALNGHLAYVSQHPVNPATGLPWKYPFQTWIGHQVAG
jgi:hypothetical protein